MRQVLHIADHVLGPKPQFRHRVKTTRTGSRGGLKSKNFVVSIFLAPPGGELVQLALQIGHEHALLPGKQSWQNEADSLPASGRCVAQHVLWAGVPQIMNFTVFVAPRSNIDPIILEQTSRFDVATVRPSGGSVKERIHFGIRAGDIQQQKHKSAKCDQGSNPESLGKKRMILWLFPLMRQQKIGPWRVDMEQVKPESGMEPIAIREYLRCDDRPQHDHSQEGYQPFRVRIKTRSSTLKLRTDKGVTFIHRSSP